MFIYYLNLYLSRTELNAVETFLLHVYFSIPWLVYPLLATTQETCDKTPNCKYLSI